ncbi:MAG: creatininase family protein [Phycisphaerae bacterium]
MEWSSLTVGDFAKAVKETGGVCVLAVGCLEKHADHLPLGTDFLAGHRIACMAAEKEPAVVFPPYYFGQIHEARPFPGCIALDEVLTLQTLRAVCDEISRNGLNKIIIYNAHGGNTHMLGYLAQTNLSQRRPYSLYLTGFDGLWPEWRRKAWRETLTTPNHGHACECETSQMLAMFPELVKMEYIKGRKTEPLGRFNHIPPGMVSARWYSDYPDHYAGDATAATAEKGRKLVGLVVDSLADYIKAVKEDTAVAALAKEFYDRCDQVGR